MRGLDCHVYKTTHHTVNSQQLSVIVTAVPHSGSLQHKTNKQKMVLYTKQQTGPKISVTSLQGT